MRAFLAVVPDDELRVEIARTQQELREAIASARARITWVRPTAIHLTIKFLGEFDERNVQPLRERVAPLVSGHSPLAIPLARLGAFPRPQAPRAIWLGPPPDWENTAEARRVDHMVQTIDDACAEFGAVRDENTWRPHLTLARVRAGEREVGRAIGQRGSFEREFSIGVLHLDAVSLVKSELRADGPVHTELWTVR